MSFSEYGSAQQLTLIKGTPATRNGYGDQVPGTVEVAVGDCVWWPSATDESTTSGDTTTSRFAVMFPDGTDVSKSDRVRLPDGTVWVIDGDPRQHMSPITGSVGRIYTWIERVTG